MMQTKNEMLESRTEAVSRDALVRAALQEITQNYREASLSNVARAYGVSLAYVSECVRAQTGMLNKYHGSPARGDKVRLSYQIECYDNKAPFLKNQYVNYKNRKYRT